MKLGALALTLGVAIPASAQTWRNIEVSRQLRDTAEQRVRVQYGAGRFDLRPTAEPVLYAMQLRYDEERAEAVHRYDTQLRTATLGVDHQSRFTHHWGGDDKSGDMHLSLSRNVPLDLDVKLGGSKATLELGGLTLRNLRIEAAATDGDVRFSSPNPASLPALDIELGAGSITVEQLANANTSTVRVKSGVGGVDLDFGGTWTHDIALDVSVALGKVAIHVPSNVGMQVDVDRFLASFDYEGLVKHGNSYTSENFDRAPHKLRVHVSTVFGGIQVDRTAP